MATSWVLLAAARAYELNKTPAAQRTRRTRWVLAVTVAFAVVFVIAALVETL